MRDFGTDLNKSYTFIRAVLILLLVAGLFLFAKAAVFTINVFAYWANGIVHLWNKIPGATNWLASLMEGSHPAIVFFPLYGAAILLTFGIPLGSYLGLAYVRQWDEEHIKNCRFMGIVMFIAFVVAPVIFFVKSGLPMINDDPTFAHILGA